ncbi:MAG: class II aldolase/adducin family protein [Pseudomonadota bacterium]
MLNLEGLTDHQDRSEVEVRRALAAVHRIAHIENFHEATWTHYSVRLLDDKGFLVTPANTYFSEVKASNLILYGADGEVLSGDQEANHDAIPIHLPIYEARPDVRCILHMHPPYATALTLLEDGRLDTLASQPAAQLYGKLAYLDVYSLPRTSTEEGVMMANALEDKMILVMKNHGILLAASSIAEAIVSAFLLERAAKLQVLASMTGQKRVRIQEKYAQSLSSQPCSGEPGYLYGMMKMLDNRHPDYRE